METEAGTVRGDVVGRRTEARPYRIAFVDDHPALLAGMVAIFRSNGRCEIVGTGVSADDALRICIEQRPEILILDLSMPGDVFAAISEIRDEAGATRIVIFTAFANVDLAIRSLDAGAHAFVLKGRPSDDLFDAITAVMAGEMFVSPGFAQQLMSGYTNRSRRERVLASARLSARESEIVQCLCEAMTNKQIAGKLRLSEKTVKHYMTNLMNKLKVKNRLEVVVAARHLQGEMADRSGAVY